MKSEESLNRENRVSRPNGPVVAIDGPAGAGKSTIAAYLARRFGLLNLETGAMYRALALKAIRTGIDSDQEEAVLALTQHTRIALEPGAEGNRVLLDGEDVTGLLRAPEVTVMASHVSVHGRVRAWMVAEQRVMGECGGVVMEGRDIGTVVFPDAEVKIFLDASPEARGERRFAQNASSGDAASRAAIVREMKERDERDRSRVESPLRAAADAIHVDSTRLTLDEVMDRVASFVEPFTKAAQNA